MSSDQLYFQEFESNTGSDSMNEKIAKKTRMNLSNSLAQIVRWPTKGRNRELDRERAQVGSQPRGSWRRPPGACARHGALPSVRVHHRAPCPHFHLFFFLRLWKRPSFSGQR